MKYEDIIAEIKNPENIVVQETSIKNGDFENIKYVMLNKNKGRVLSVWGCDAKNPPKWVMNGVVAMGQIVKLSPNQFLTVFSEISYKYLESQKRQQLTEQKVR